MSTLSSPRNPPRFVPTLTEVVPDTSAAPLPPVTPVPVSVPVVAPEPVPVLVMEAAPPLSPLSPPPVAVPDGFEEMLVHRVMQRVDLGLEQRLRDAIATVVQEQTRSVLPRLREEIESVVRQVVYEAVADELERKN
ncbi:MAG: hypothetical protein KA216_03420 [Giesbergeria sp.]|nr:hypothetical protein [Giesbergeria sp.]